MVRSDQTYAHLRVSHTHMQPSTWYPLHRDPLLCAFRPGSNTLFAVSKWLFAVPFIGWLARHLGCIPATYKSITKALETNTVILVPGGVPELVSGEWYTRRHGFLKIAKQMDIPIVPVLVDDYHYERLPFPLPYLQMYLARTFDLPVMLLK